jgi:parallel beta-helix repeat protein
LAGLDLTGGVIVRGGSPVIRRCAIRGGQEFGLELKDAAEGLVEENVIEGNRFAGITVSGSGAVTIRANVIRDSPDAGIWLRDDAAPLIQGNVIYGNAFGIDDEAMSTPIVEENELLGNGIAIGFGSTGVYRRNTVEESWISVRYGGLPTLEENNGLVTRAWRWRGGVHFALILSDLVPVAIEVLTRPDHEPDHALFVHPRGGGQFDQNFLDQPLFPEQDVHALAARAGIEPDTDQFWDFPELLYRELTRQHPRSLAEVLSSEPEDPSEDPPFPVSNRELLRLLLATYTGD